MADETGAGLDPDLEQLAATLRATWRADYEEIADEARMQWEHGRTFIDRIQDAMARGDRAECTLPYAQFRGTVTNLGTNWCTITTKSGPVDVHLTSPGPSAPGPVLFRTLERGRVGGTRAPQPPMGFRARCYELEMAREPVQVGGLVHDDVLVGALTVGADHLVVSGSHGDAMLPLAWVGWIAHAYADD